MTYRVTRDRRATALLAAIHRQALHAIRADRLIDRAVSRGRLAASADGLVVDGTIVPWGGRVVLLTAGKAALSMARGIARLIGPRLDGGIAVTKDEPPGAAPLGMKVIEGAHPIPDARSERAASALLEAIEQLFPSDLVIAGISGGASSLCAAPRPPFQLADIAQRSRDLLASGASIAEINRERRELLLLAGGRLAAATRARVVTLVISDLPELPDSRCRSALETAALVGSGPTVVEGGATNGPIAILATPADLEQALASAAGRWGLCARPLPFSISLDVEDLVPRLLDTARTSDADLLYGVGEPTVHLPPHPGRGGRAQQLALLAALELASLGGPPFALLAAGSDGSDGPTEAAGATADRGAVARAARRGVSGIAARVACDSLPFHAAAGTLFATGATGANLLDALLLGPGFLRPPRASP